MDPIAAVTAGIVSGGMGVGMWVMTEYFARMEMFGSGDGGGGGVGGGAAVRFGSLVRTMLVGGGALGTGFCLAIGVGLVGLGGRVAWGVYVEGDLDPGRKVVGRGGKGEEWELPTAFELMMGKRREGE